MNAEITRIRTELNEAIYIMIDADSDKRYNAAATRVRWLRRDLHIALRDWLYPRTCFYCNVILSFSENRYCPDCQADEDAASEEIAWCQHCGDEMEPDGSDYCETCWPDVMGEVTA